MRDKPEKIHNKVIRILSDYTDVKVKSICGSMSLADDLGLSSFDVVCISVSFEEAFEIRFDSLDSFKGIETVDDLVSYIRDYKLLSEKHT
jgi:Acyl carrier protein